MRHKLNALLLYKYQHSKATRELAEVREALTNLQKGKVDDGPATAENGLFAVGKNLPAGLTSAYAGIRSAGIRQVGGRNRNSTSSGESQSHIWHMNLTAIALMLLLDFSPLVVYSFLVLYRLVDTFCAVGVRVRQLSLRLLCGKWVVVGMADCSVIAFCCGPSLSSGSSSWGLPKGLAA